MQPSKKSNATEWNCWFKTWESYRYSTSNAVAYSGGLGKCNLDLIEMFNLGCEKHVGKLRVEGDEI